MPPLPPASTIGTSPDGAGRADSLANARAAASLGDVLHPVALEDLVPLGAGQRLVAGLHPGVAVGHARDVEARPDLLVLGEQAVRVGDEDAAPAVAAADLHLGDGVAGGTGGLVGPGEQLELARLVHRVRGRAVAPPVGRQRVEGHRAHAVAALAGHGGSRPGRREQPRLTQVGGVGEARRLAVDDPDPGPARPARGELLDPAVVQQGTRRHGVLGEDLGHVAAADQGGGQHAFEHVSGR